MRIITRKVEQQPLTVIIEYPKMDASVERFIDKVKHMDICFVGKANDTSAKIDISDVYYIENVERKVFLYTEKEVYRLSETMTDLTEIAEDTELVRVSRTCMINTGHLKEMKQIKNSHLEAVLDNDEKIIVSRKYLKEIKNVFKRNGAL